MQSTLNCSFKSSVELFHLNNRYPNSMVGFFQVVSSKYNTIQQLTEVK
jgi:hypothetical protein